MKKTVLVFMIIALFLGGVSGFVHGAAQDFTLINKTGVDIYYLYISPANSNNWGKDLLGESILSNGENIYIRFSGQPERWWDLKVKDKNGNTAYWKNLDLSLINQLTLYCDGVYVWAEYQ